MKTVIVEDSRLARLELLELLKKDGLKHISEAVGADNQ